MTAYEDDAREYADDPRVTGDGAGGYVVDRSGFPFHVLAVAGFGWVVTRERSLRGVHVGAGAVIGFNDADQAIAYVFDQSATTAREEAA